MDIDIKNIRVSLLKDKVMEILQSAAFSNNLKPFGIEKIITPNIAAAKQTETTQRFKLHLIAYAGEDLFTKVEFSRRGMASGAIVEPVSDKILRIYKLPPLLAPHYNIQAAAVQKINALISRTIVQARDIFDLYILSSQYGHIRVKEATLNADKLKKAYENILEVSFKQFQDTILSYLSQEEQAFYNSEDLWDEIKLRVNNFIEELFKNDE
jgi:hypothetical protein